MLAESPNLLAAIDRRPVWGTLKNTCDWQVQDAASIFHLFCVLTEPIEHYGGEDSWKGVDNNYTAMLFAYF